MLSYLAQFFLEREIFQSNAVETIKNTFLFNNLFSKILPLLDNVEK
jgi:hypothetical protein